MKGDKSLGLVILNHRACDTLPRTLLGTPQLLSSEIELAEGGGDTSDQLSYQPQKSLFTFEIPQMTTLCMKSAEIAQFLWGFKRSD